jgi:Putative GTPase activating protein for Arf
MNAKTANVRNQPTTNATMTKSSETTPPPRSSAEEMRARLDKVLASKGNEICADCPGLKPLWASFLRSRKDGKSDPAAMEDTKNNIDVEGELAVLVCTDCAKYHHIELGKRYCSMKYVKYSHELTPVDMDILERSGNSLVNKYYEAKLTTDLFDKELVDWDKEKEANRRAKFIKNKYKKVKYRNHKGLAKSIFGLQEEELQKERVMAALKRSRSSDEGVKVVDKDKDQGPIDPPPQVLRGSRNGDSSGTGSGNKSPANNNRRALRRRSSFGDLPDTKRKSEDNASLSKRRLGKGVSAPVKEPAASGRIERFQKSPQSARVLRRRSSFGDLQDTKRKSEDNASMSTQPLGKGVLRPLKEPSASGRIEHYQRKTSKERSPQSARVLRRRSSFRALQDTKRNNASMSTRRLGKGVLRPVKEPSASGRIEHYQRKTSKERSPQSAPKCPEMKELVPVRSSGRSRSPGGTGGRRPVRRRSSFGDAQVSSLVSDFRQTKNDLLQKMARPAKNSRSKSNESSASESSGAVKGLANYTSSKAKVIGTNAGASRNYILDMKTIPRGVGTVVTKALRRRSSFGDLAASLKKGMTTGIDDLKSTVNKMRAFQKPNAVLVDDSLLDDSLLDESSVGQRATRRDKSSGQDVARDRTSSRTRQGKSKEESGSTQSSHILSNIPGRSKSYDTDAIPSLLGSTINPRPAYMQRKKASPISR